MEETLKHIITECPWYDGIRREFEEKVKEIKGEEWEEIKNGEHGGLEYVLGIDTEERSCEKETKEMLRKIWNRRKEEGRERRNFEEHRY